MLESNKTCWEGFEMKADIEVNHAWTSYPAYLFLKYIVGVQPTSGGFGTFDLRPATGGLASAEGAVPTVKGLIAARWEQEAGDRFRLSVEVPANTEATVYLPKPARGDFVVLESGRQVWPTARAVPGVNAVEEGDGWVRCVVGSGSYRFARVPLGRDAGA